jgi:hypothetical protein
MVRNALLFYEKQSVLNVSNRLHKVRTDFKGLSPVLSDVRSKRKVSPDPN